MKSIIFLAVLAVLTVSVISDDTGVEEPVSARQNLILGSIGNGNVLLHRNNYVRRAQANAIQWQEITLRAASNIRITAIRAVELGVSQGASARLLSGGIGQTHAKVRLQTARGRGYNYQLEIWGRRV
ncbi:uncharacterized protein LOC113494245 [Trichoplusia ni]|uniref:Uncharacterized protein LOC113494245 n=1 Tax=Trichoplusia ni TaxID=7111 RepID=A0A7E5VJ49_TRINI|nr:uncharacterized protein LOC113494245 [Trichoplusia ni]